jgi:hypothetical protein
MRFFRDGERTFGHLHHFKGNPGRLWQMTQTLEIDVFLCLKILNCFAAVETFLTLSVKNINSLCIMDVIQLEGDDRQLFDLVAHLVMSEEVLRYNLNYPYKTSPKYRWFIAVEEGKVLGFIPVKRRGGTALVNNYYVGGDDGEVFSVLLKEIIGSLSPDFAIESITQMRHVPNFEQNGFSVIFLWRRYVKMKVVKDEKECI